VKSYDRSSLGVILVPQEVVAAFDAINHKTRSLQGGKHFRGVTCGSRLMHEQA
jgi:hypothetical protein